MDSLREILERNRHHQVRQVYLARGLLQLNPGESTTERYSLALDIREDDPSLDGIAVLRSPKQDTSLWVYSPLSDLVGVTTLGIVSEDEERILAELKARGDTALSYHPELEAAEELRQQFFARVRELDRLTRGLGYEVPIIGQKEREEYEEDIAAAPEVEEFRIVRPAA